MLTKLNFGGLFAEKKKLGGLFTEKKVGREKNLFFLESPRFKQLISIRIF